MTINVNFHVDWLQKRGGLKVLVGIQYLIM